jgi:hypothetical protein
MAEKWMVVTFEAEGRQMVGIMYEEEFDPDYYGDPLPDRRFDTDGEAAKACEEYSMGTGIPQYSN